MLIKKSSATIIRVDETKVTKFVLVDAVGSEAAEAGIKVGDVVVPTALSHIVLDAGVSFRPSLEEKNVAFFVTGVAPNEFLVQTDAGTQFVPFDSPEAAQPLGGARTEQESEAA